MGIVISRRDTLCRPQKQLLLCSSFSTLLIVDGVCYVVVCSTLAKCSSDLCLLLAHGLEDAFPDAKRAAAAGLAALAAKLPQDALEDSAERLVQVRAVLRK